MAHGTMRTAARLLTIASPHRSIAAITVGSASAGGGVRAVKVAGGLNGSAAFTFTPNGTIVYLERGHRARCASATRRPTSTGASSTSRA